MKGVVVFDIETAYNIGAYFGKTYDTQIAKIIQRGYVLGFAWKYTNEKNIHTCYIWDYPLYKKEPKNDIEVIKKWVQLMEQSSVVVGWNSDKFDNRVMYGRVLVHKLPPVSMPRSYDVMKAIKRVAGYDSYKLDDISEMWGHGNKLQTNIDLWVDCVMGNKKAQKQMVTYNKRDVEVTEKNYFDILPHAKNHPRTDFSRPDACPRCNGVNLQSRGTVSTNTTVYKRFRCMDCGHWPRFRTAEKMNKVLYV